MSIFGAHQYEPNLQTVEWQSRIRRLARKYYTTHLRNLSARRRLQLELQKFYADETYSSNEIMALIDDVRMHMIKRPEFPFAQLVGTASLR